MSTQAFAPAVDVPVTKKRGRPRKHADGAARSAAWREANQGKVIRLDANLATSVETLAQMFDCTETHVTANLVRFALANRNWKGLGIGGWAKADARFAKGRRPAPAERDDSLDSFSLV